MNIYFAKSFQIREQTLNQIKLKLRNHFSKSLENIFFNLSVSNEKKKNLKKINFSLFFNIF